MHTSIFVSAMLALAVSATPVLKVVEEVHTVTAYVTAGQPLPTKAAVAAAPAAANNGGDFLQHPAAAPKPSTQAPSAPSTGNADTDAILAVANKYRAMYSLPTFTWDDSMVDNCQEAGGNGKDEVHKMIPNAAMGQCLTPGQNVLACNSEGRSAFELAYGAWMCEKATDEQLVADGICPIVQRCTTMSYGGDTGHYDILVNPSYTKFAAAFTPNAAGYDSTAMFQGLWAADLAP